MSSQKNTENSREQRQRRPSERQMYQLEEQAAQVQRRAAQAERRERAATGGADTRKRPRPPATSTQYTSRVLVSPTGTASPFQNMVRQHTRMKPTPVFRGPHNEGLSRREGSLDRMEGSSTGRHVRRRIVESDDEVITVDKGALASETYRTHNYQDATRLAAGGDEPSDDDGPGSASIIEDDDDGLSDDGGNNRTHSQLSLQGGAAPKVTKLVKHHGRARAKDFDEEAQEIIAVASAIFRCKISTINAFPDHAQEIQWAKEAWAEGCERTGFDLRPTIDIIKMLARRVSQLRGEIKTKARPLVDTMYGFSHGQHQKAIHRNRDRAERLKLNQAFVYKSNINGELKGLFRADIIQKLINAAWFANRRDEGVAFSEYFNPFPIQGIALVLTAVECGIDEWMTGIRLDIKFTSEEYKAVYEQHVASLEAFEKHSAHRQIIPKICIKLHNNARFHAGAEPLTDEPSTKITTAAFDAAILEDEDNSHTESSGDELGEDSQNDD